MTVLDPQTLEGIRGNAAMVLRDFTPLAGFQLGFDERSVIWVEGFLERQRARGPEFAEDLIDVIGSYLGEAVIAVAGGAWEQHMQGRIGIHFPEGSWAFPFAKVSKQARDGLEGGESIASFYAVCRDLVATGKLTQASARAPDQE